MVKRYLIDTNVAVGYLENQLPQQTVNKLSDTIIKLSVVTRIELLAWPDASPQQLEILQNFIVGSFVFGLDEAIIIESINVRKQYKIKLPDAIIAATALVNNLTLLTRNISDFKKVVGLDIFNPF